MSKEGKDLYGDIVRATTKASVRGVAGAQILAVMIAALVKEARAQGLNNMSELVEGLQAGVEFNAVGEAG